MFAYLKPGPATLDLNSPLPESNSRCNRSVASEGAEADESLSSATPADSPEVILIQDSLDNLDCLECSELSVVATLRQDDPPCLGSSGVEAYC